MNNRYYTGLSIEEIENNLQTDIAEHRKNIIKTLLIIAIFFAFIFRGALIYWIKFSVAIPNAYTKEIIDVSKDPVQVNYSASEQKQKTFTYHSLINNNEVTIIPQAHYILSGRVIAYNHDFLFISKFFDSISLYDLGMAWGDMTDKTLYKKYIKIYSTKTELTGARRLHWSWNGKMPYTEQYISSHFSHTHIIPANRNIMAAMLKIRKYNYIKLEGELVDMGYYDRKNNKKINYYTSLSRKDSDFSSRGSGACEAMYVTKVQIGNKIYE